MQAWQNYMVEMVSKAPFVPYNLDFDLGNPEIQAHLSLEKYLDHFCYINKAGKTWTLISMIFKPKVIVELGTAFGNRTNLIGKLNPGAKLYSVDTQSPYPLRDKRVDTGYLAVLNRIPFTFIHGKSWETKIDEKINLCFIDADHSEESVYKDSRWMWANKDEDDWCIVWDDYALPTVVRAVDRFCKEVGYSLQTIGGYKYIFREVSKCS